MNLTSEEERALRGEYGEALATAYRILVAVGKAADAERLIPVSSAHISGVTYHALSDAGLEFLEDFSRTAKVVIPTTVNPCGIDTENPNSILGYGIDEDYVKNQLRVVNAYLRMGVTSSFSCIPFEGYLSVEPGSHVSWAESSAVIYGNSFLGVKCNRESGISALASAVTGKTPLSGLHLDENRRPSLVIKVKVPLKSTLDYGLLGYFAGKIAKDTVGFLGVKTLGKPEAKALSAAIGTSGSIGMFTLEDSPQDIGTVIFGQQERQQILDELSDPSQPGAVVLGCPQLTLEEMATIATGCEGRRFKARCLLFCSRKIYQKGIELGYVEKIRKAGGEFLCDSCGDLCLAMRGLGSGCIVTDTVKGAYYMKHAHSLKVVLQDLDTILGEWTG